MSINKFNSEGYYDPTAYKAMTNVEKEKRASQSCRPLVYICSPYSGNVTANVQAAREYCRIAVEKGYIPVAPHLLYPQFMAFCRRLDSREQEPFRYSGISLLR